MSNKHSFSRSDGSNDNSDDYVPNDIPYGRKGNYKRGGYGGDRGGDGRSEAESRKSHHASCHRCGNIRKKYAYCDSCPQVFCMKCMDKMIEEHGKDCFSHGCPVCKKLCCCSEKTMSCTRKYHCYKKCLTTKKGIKRAGITHNASPPTSPRQKIDRSPIPLSSAPPGVQAQEDPAMFTHFRSQPFAGGISSLLNASGQLSYPGRSSGPIGGMNVPPVSPGTGAPLQSFPIHEYASSDKMQGGSVPSFHLPPNRPNAQTTSSSHPGLPGSSAAPPAAPNPYQRSGSGYGLLSTNSLDITSLVLAAEAMPMPVSAGKSGGRDSSGGVPAERGRVGAGGFLPPTALGTGTNTGTNTEVAKSESASANGMATATTATATSNSNSNSNNNSNNNNNNNNNNSAISNTAGVAGSGALSSSPAGLGGTKVARRETEQAIPSLRLMTSLSSLANPFNQPPAPAPASDFAFKDVHGPGFGGYSAAGSSGLLSFQGTGSTDMRSLADPYGVVPRDSLSNHLTWDPALVQLQRAPDSIQVLNNSVYESQPLLQPCFVPMKSSDPPLRRQPSLMRQTSLTLPNAPVPSPVAVDTGALLAGAVVPKATLVRAGSSSSVPAAVTEAMMATLARRDSRGQMAGVHRAVSESTEISVNTEICFAEENGEVGGERRSPLDNTRETTSELLPGISSEVVSCMPDNSYASRTACPLENVTPPLLSLSPSEIPTLDHIQLGKKE